MPATEQCVIIDGVVFLNTPTSMARAAAGGRAQHHDVHRRHAADKVFEDDGIYVFKFHVDWADPPKTTLSGPQKIAVAPYTICATAS